MRNRVFLAVCGLLLAAVLIYAPCHKLLVNAGVIDYRQMGNVIENEVVREGFLSEPLNAVEDFKTELRDTYINHLPAYVDLVIGYKKLLFSLNKQTLAPQTPAAEPLTQPENTEPSIPYAQKPHRPTVTTTFLMQDSTHRYYDFTYTDSSGERHSFLDRSVNRTAAQIAEVTDRNLNHINRLAATAKEKEVNFFLYVCRRAQESDFCQTIMPEEPNLDPVLTGLLEGLSPNVAYDCFSMKTIEDRLALVYATDHHWNATGAHVGYTQIIELINRTAPVGEPKQPLQFYTLPDCHFYGSCARTTGYMQYYDAFTFADYGLPAHEVADNLPVSDKIQQYLNGDYDHDAGASHYEYFYGDVTGFSFPDNHTGRNLLILCDSFGRAVNEVIASHFDNTYVHYIWSDEQLALESFIDEKGITDILVLQVTNRLLADVAGDCHFENILTD